MSFLFGYFFKIEDNKNQKDQNNKNPLNLNNYDDIKLSNKINKNEFFININYDKNTKNFYDYNKKEKYIPIVYDDDEYIIKSLTDTINPYKKESHNILNNCEIIEDYFLFNNKN